MKKKYLNSGVEIIEDKSVVQNDMSLFYKIQNQLLDSKLLDLVTKDETSFLISYPGLLGHSVFSFKSPQGTSWIIANTEISIRSTFCLPGSGPFNNKPLKDIKSLSLDGILSQREGIFFIKDLNLSLRSKNHPTSSFGMKYHSLEPYLADGSLSSTTTSIEYFHNLDQIVNFDPEFSNYLELGLFDVLPKTRFHAHQFVSDGFKNNLQKQAQKFLASNTELSFPEFNDSITSNDFSYELTKKYLDYFGFPNN
jgi:hypothetical protein